MSATNGNATNHFAAAAVKFDPLAALQFWQKSASRFSRANEVLVRGFTAAARLQVELGQELIQSQLSAFTQITPGEKPESILKTQIAHQTEDAHHLFEAIRKISDEIRLSFTEASRTLLETEAPAPAESIAASARKPDFTPSRKSAASKEASESN
jgi:hypothetical protein